MPYHLLSRSNAIDLFTGSVVAQQAHYLAVIVVLPLLLSRWSPGCHGPGRLAVRLIFYGGLGILAGRRLRRLLRSASSAMPGRSYSLLAAIHAWIEIPILIVALATTLPDRQQQSAPVNEAPLATSETQHGVTQLEARPSRR